MVTPVGRSRARGSAWAAAGVLALVLPVTGAAGPAGSAQAVPVPAAGAGVVSEYSPTPPDGVFHLQGHGYGTGVGLSQWGAEGGAEGGATVAQILDRYYPGTGAAALPAGPATQIRVLLTAAGSTSATLWPAAGMVVTGADGTAIRPSVDASHTRVRLVASGTALELQSSADGVVWHSDASLRSPATVTEPGAVVRVAHADGTSADYRGRLVVTAAGGGVRVVDTLPMEDYLRGVVPRESPPSWRPAALQAQAVAARSFAAAAAAAGAGQTYDLCDSAACQVYGGIRSYPRAGAPGGPVAVETAGTDAAVSATASIVRTFGGATISAQYGASDGGYTVAGGTPYLPAAADPWDGADPANTEHVWTATVSALQLARRFPALGSVDSLEVTQRDGNGEWGGRVLQAVIRGHAGSAPTAVAVTGADLASANPWPSPGGVHSAWWVVTGAVPEGGAAPPPSTSGMGVCAPAQLAHAVAAHAVAARTVAARTVAAHAVAAHAVATRAIVTRTVAAHAVVTRAATGIAGPGLAPAASPPALITAALTTAPRRVVVAGRGCVPATATAVMVVAAAGPHTGSALSTVLAWPTPEASPAGLAGSAAAAGRQYDIVLDRLAERTPTGGSGLVRLGPDGAFELATSTGRAGVTITVVGWVGPSATTGLVAAAGVPVLLARTAAKGSSVVGLRPPAGAVGALLAVTSSGDGSVTVGGVPIVSAGRVGVSVATGQAPRMTTTLTGVTGVRLQLSTPTRVRLQVLAWLVPGGLRFAGLGPAAQPTTVLGPGSGRLRLAGAAGVPGAATAVLAQLTVVPVRARAPRPGGALLTIWPHGTPGPGAAFGVGAGPVTALAFMVLPDPFAVVRAPSRVRVSVTVVDWAARGR